jgi:hypothetical protein
MDSFTGKEVLNKYLGDDIAIVSKYSKTINNMTLYIYVAYCDGVLTKYICQKEWNFYVKVFMNNETRELIYLDDEDNEILVYGRDDDGYDDI